MTPPFWICHYLPGVLGEFSRQAWQVTSYPKSPRTTGNEADMKPFVRTSYLGTRPSCLPSPGRPFFAADDRKLIFCLGRTGSPVKSIRARVRARENHMNPFVRTSFLGTRPSCLPSPGRPFFAADDWKPILWLGRTGSPVIRGCSQSIDPLSGWCPLYKQGCRTRKWLPFVRARGKWFYGAVLL